MMKFARLAIALSLLGPLACGKKGAPESAPADSADMPPAHAKAAAAAAADGDEPNHADRDDHADHFEHRFEKAADWQKQFDDPERDGWQKPERVVELLELDPGMVVADIGAGTGYFLRHFSRAVGAKGKVLALDIEPDMVRHMKERAASEKLANVTARVVDPADPALEASSVDRIVIVNTWHHIGDRVAYAAKLRAALRPGGTIAVIDYTLEAPRGPPAKHRLSPAEVEHELEKAGLTATTLSEDLPLQYVVVAKVATPR